jgi:hypothetical protein
MPATYRYFCAAASKKTFENDASFRAIRASSLFFPAAELYDQAGVSGAIRRFFRNITLFLPSHHNVSLKTL